MLRISIFFFISSFTLCNKTQNPDNIIGTYLKQFEVHDAYSILMLLENNRFKYSSGIGGCQTGVEGEWRLKEQNLLIFSTDSIYTEEYFVRREKKYLKEAKETFQIDKDTANYRLNISLAKLRPCYPNLTEAILNKKTIILKNDIPCACLPVNGKYRKYKPLKKCLFDKK